jgi:hypothetical protein
VKKHDRRAGTDIDVADLGIDHLHPTTWEMVGAIGLWRRGDLLGGSAVCRSSGGKG